MSEEKSIRQHYQENFQKGIDALKTKYNIESVKFYYVRNDANVPMVTVAIAKSKDGIYYRAFSICSIHEKSCLKIWGRREAIRRLRKIIVEGVDDVHRLSGDPAALAQTFRLPNVEADGYGVKYKLGQINIQPTEQEKKMLK